MSSLNPLAGSSSGAGASDPIALELAALKADADALRSLLASGDIVAAKVLAFNGLSDLIEILGKRVAASLPPTVRPGDTLILEVAGFDGDRIIVRNLGIDASAARTTFRTPSPPAPADGTAAPKTTPGPLPESPPPELPPATAESAPETLLPSSSHAPAPAAQPASSTAPGEPRPVGSPPPAAGYPRVTISIPSRAIETEQSIEARLIAARTTVKPPIAGNSNPPARSGPAAAPAAATTTRAAAAASRVPAPAAASSPSPLPVAPRAPAWIETAARQPAAAAAAAAAAEAAETPARPASGQQSPQSPASVPAQRSVQTYREPVLLLRSLHIPVTPTNVAAAKLALETPQRLPVALAALEKALPLGTADPRVNTMRTIAGFLANLDPRSENFAQQLSAYISHVVEGPEPKLAQMLRAFAQAAEPAPEAPAPATGQPTFAQQPPANESAAQQTTARTAVPQQAAPAPAGTTPPGPVQPNVTTIAHTDPVVAARIVERAAALDYDLKTQLQVFIAQPPPNASPASLTAAHSALAALTAAQLNNVVAQGDPRSLTLSIPLPVMNNGNPARITISREKPKSKERLDADNFHIAFVLDTKNVGTVAIDLQTIGRAVNLSVKSETPRYAAAFKSMLEQLGGRLEHLRYNVVSLDSAVVSRAGATVETAAPPAAPQDDGPASGVDLQA